MLCLATHCSLWYNVSMGTVKEVRMGIKIQNNSHWPTWLVRWMGRKAASDAGVTQWTLDMKPGQNKTWGGRGGRRDARVWCQRRALKAAHATWLFRYFGYKEGNSCRDHIPHTTIALLAKIIRHEVEHAGEGHPSNFRKTNGRHDDWLMEMHCNEMAAKWVNGLTDRWWSEVYPEWKRLARAEREAAKLVDKTDKRIEETTYRLAEWSRKLKLAQTKVKKYRTRLAAQERRAATRSK